MARTRKVLRNSKRRMDRSVRKSKRRIRKTKRRIRKTKRRGSIKVRRDTSLYQIGGSKQDIDLDELLQKGKKLGEDYLLEADGSVKQSTRSFTQILVCYPGTDKSFKVDIDPIGSGMTLLRFLRDVVFERVDVSHPPRSEVPPHSPEEQEHLKQLKTDFTVNYVSLVYSICKRIAPARFASQGVTYSSTSGLGELEKTMSSLCGLKFPSFFNLISSQTQMAEIMGDGEISSSSWDFITKLSTRSRYRTHAWDICTRMNSILSSANLCETFITEGMIRTYKTGPAEEALRVAKQKTVSAIGKAAESEAETPAEEELKERLMDLGQGVENKLGI